MVDLRCVGVHCDAVDMSIPVDRAITRHGIHRFPGCYWGYLQILEAFINPNHALTHVLVRVDTLAASLSYTARDL